MRPWELHPALVHFPVAFVIGAVLLDLVAWRRAREDLARVAAGLLAAGVATGLVAAVAGVLAFYTVPAHTADGHALMAWHLSTMVVALGLLALALPRRPTETSRALAAAGALVLVAGAFLGGELVYKGGAGVDPSILAPEVQHHVHG